MLIEKKTERKAVGNRAVTPQSTAAEKGNWKESYSTDEYFSRLNVYIYN